MKEYRRTLLAARAAVEQHHKSDNQYNGYSRHVADLEGKEDESRKDYPE